MSNNELQFNFNHRQRLTKNSSPQFLLVSSECFLYDLTESQVTSLAIQIPNQVHKMLLVLHIYETDQFIDFL